MLGDGVTVMSELLREATKRLLKMHFEAGVGHIGGNLSVLPILLELFHGTKKADEPVILSKGHAAGALYVTLWTMGLLSDSDLKTFHGDNTLLAGHPPPSGLLEVPFATGSLGHGLGLANGMALAAKLKNLGQRVFCVTSDGEWNEGSMWESLVFSAQHSLKNLIVIIDRNGLQGFGSSKEVADLEPLEERFRAFRCEVRTLELSRYGVLRAAVESRTAESPLVLIVNTMKGHGVSFMQNKMEWHYLPMTPAQYEQAIKEVATV